MDSVNLKQTSQKEQEEIEHPLLAYIHNFTDVPEPKNLRHDDFIYIGWKLKRTFGYFVILLEIIYMQIMGYLTAYYPFSLLHVGKLFHARHKKLKRFIHDVERISRKAKMPIFATGGDDAGPVYIVSANPESKMQSDKLKVLQKLFEKKYKDIIISEDNGNIKIVIPQDCVF